MVKLNPALLRYLGEEDFRVLVAIELCMRNHQIVPTALIGQVAKLPRGGVEKRIGEILRCELIHRDRSCYEGYTLKYSGYDYLALHTFVSRSVLFSFGHAVACGKESDVYLASDFDGNVLIVKLERLGRCSFRSVVRNRSYLTRNKRGGASWFYLSRLAALREFSFMKVLYDEGFRVPKPIDHNRHAIVMEKINGTSLCHTHELRDPSKTFHECLDLIVKFAESSLIHCDFNEYNLIMTEDTEEVVVIDFPQMISTKHPNAASYFERDVQCVHTFFERRFGLTFDRFPVLAEIEQKSDIYNAVMKGDWRSEHEHDFFELMGNLSNEDDGEADDDDQGQAGQLNTEETKKESHTIIRELDTVKDALSSLVIDQNEVRRKLKKEKRKENMKNIRKSIRN
ncbi:conserved RIO1-domain protein [Perkinsela sp. CCAP 1560/4]|nr:conserved RIO1-domain protein [Perkinsela sp. CCAP 1560/4]|eukprot:KNH06326.1 conserved RIO1-domain protein [Perkinsela sp. CCAP 1560/4]